VRRLRERRAAARVDDGIGERDRVALFEGGRLPVAGRTDTRVGRFVGDGWFPGRDVRATALVVSGGSVTSRSGRRLRVCLQATWDVIVVDGLR
jgi:hypothetical protein